jgi:hypothetical protein
VLPRYGMAVAQLSFVSAQLFLYSISWSVSVFRIIPQSTYVGIKRVVIVVIVVIDPMLVSTIQTVSKVVLV